MARVKTTNFDVSPWVPCLSCNAPITIDDRYFERFFVESHITCLTCKQSIDWWKTALRGISDNFMLNQAFGLISAKSTYFRLRLQPGKRISYKLANYAVPKDAKVLYVNYTPMGNLFPAELHGNVPTQKASREEVVLWPVPLGDEPPSDTELQVLVTWVPHSRLDDSWKNMVTAFEAYVANEFAAVIVPANVAVESSLAIMLKNYLPRHVGQERTKTFLKDAATYSHQLNVVLPLLVSLLKLPALPEHIRGLLNSLRNLRNEVAHLGTTDEPVGKERCAELLCAALFGFQYVRFLQSKLT